MISAITSFWRDQAKLQPECDLATRWVMENGAEECNAIVNMAPATTTTIASPACSGRCLSNNSSGRGFSSLSRMGSGTKSCPDYDYLDSMMSMRSTRIHSSRSFHSASIVLASDEEADLCAALGDATIGAGATMKRWRVEDHTTAAPCIMVTRPDVDWRVSTQPAQSESENVLTGWSASVR